MIQLDVLKFETDFYIVDTSQYVGGYTYNTITFLNSGTSVALIENIITLQPNQQFEIAGSVGEVSQQRFLVNFGSSTSGNSVTVIRKRYLNVAEISK